MADRIVVLKDGVVQQIATPQVMYDHPDNVFVAGFIGSPAMNFIRANLQRENGGLAVAFGNTKIPLSREVSEEAESKGTDLSSYTGKEVILGIRPEHIEDASVEEAAAFSGGESSMMEVEPQVIESMGSEKYVYFEVPNEQAAHLQSVEEMTDAGATGSANPDDSGEMMVARVSAASRAQRGEKMRLAIDASKVRLFDAESEQAIL